jgi:hypothetical protein
VFLSLGQYLCWWTISPRGYHPPSSQCFYHWVNTSAGGLFVLEDIIRPVVSVLALSWFIRYIFITEIYSSEIVNQNKAKVLLPQSLVTLSDFGYPVWWPWVLLLPKLYIFWLSYLSNLSVPDEGHSTKGVVRTKFDIYVFIWRCQRDNKKLHCAKSLGFFYVLLP